MTPLRHSPVPRIASLLAAATVSLAAVLTPVVAHAATPTDTLLAYDVIHGVIYEIGADGTQSVFASGLSTFYYAGIVTNAAGDVYATDGDSVVKFSRSGGTPTTLFTVSGQTFYDVAIDAAGDVFAQDFNNIEELSATGTRSTFAAGNQGYTLASNSAGDLYSNDFSNLDRYPASTHTATLFHAGGSGADGLAVAPDQSVWGDRSAQPRTTPPPEASSGRSRPPALSVAWAQAQVAACTASTSTAAPSGRCRAAARRRPRSRRCRARRLTSPSSRPRRAPVAPGPGPPRPARPSR